MTGFLPYGRQYIDDADVAAVAAVLKGDWLTTGPAVEKMEAALAAAVQAPHAVACNSGTAALHLAALALGLGAGDTALVPAITFMASANAARYVGAEVAFVDVDPATGLSFPAHFEAALARAPGAVKAAFPVHYAGRCADPAGLADFAARHRVDVVEDACHALGTVYDVGGHSFAVGSGAHARLCAFSFHPVKTIAMGEGGAVTTRDADLAARMARLRSHGIERDPARFVDRTAGFAADGTANPWYHELSELGFNYRASDLNCALAESQLRKLPFFSARRRALAARYDALLAPLSNVVRPLANVAGCAPVLHLYAVSIDFLAVDLDRARAMAELKARGVGTQVHYIPVHRQPYYRARYGDVSLPGAEAFYARCLSLPLFVGMADSDVDRVVAALVDVLGRAGS
ncbi:MAG: UDP-4-amino-4,6-dideoxy-N-acetyl-beta-L-altrosamine transaminase [Alphaproteobacteria bacterium]|nr:UDP-4-amino-4,6-dideoxy-N-acetyl-beta-L-altrosamine transaminase [Alphaproteobacteria bacterium]